ncbi:uncharacterized protein DSM5745_09814 [Aspergillus mulundensis]|uniref:Uncharacterized protein n=1 Tax=Aspergillus mulundensis TaxID=1810919 RepID=A0A3D8QRF7_9EURO|nr:hypothetical protein DSM5745_09814 [Aspergillus mulundensis]RDW64403.1 hypothetical protein DSM5745_09814 [Aspergillus mulundensis]
MAPTKLSNHPMQILTASIDLENRKSDCVKSAERDYYIDALEEDEDADFETIQQRGCRQKSVQLIEEVARHFADQNIRHYWIFCGYRVPEKKWQVYIGFFMPKMANAQRISIKLEVISKFLDGRPDRDLTVDRFGKLPFRLILHWMRPKGWAYMSRLEMISGIPHTVKEGKDGHMQWLRPRVRPRGPDYVPSWFEGGPGFFSKVLSKIAPSAEAQTDENLQLMTLDQVLEKMKGPSADELLDSECGDGLQLPEYDDLDH